LTSIISAYLGLRNMTWAGAQGFQTPIVSESLVLKNMGIYGNEHTERGLTCTQIFPLYLHRLTKGLDVEFYFSGHMNPVRVSSSLHPTIGTFCSAIRAMGHVC
jgi:carboxypeptidase D